MLKSKLPRLLFACLNRFPLAGGIRASLYNGMPIEGVDTLVSFMKDFATENAA